MRILTAHVVAGLLFAVAGCQKNDSTTPGNMGDAGAAQPAHPAYPPAQ